MLAPTYPPRRGVALLVVLSLLTLFAVVGLCFVLYASTEAQSARSTREAMNQTGADVEPELLLSYFLHQLVLDVSDDDAGIYSALRGHSLARNMYGYNSGTMSQPAANVVPFNGVGRLHFSNSVPALDDYALINYTYFASDGFLRHPERIAVVGDPRGDYAGGFNAPYTYPDLNSTFLAAVRASDGAVLLPSYHRPWTAPAAGFPADAGEFYDRTTGQLHPFWQADAQPPTGFKYTTLRPLPALNPGFPPPQDGGGDVKNLMGGPGTLRRMNGSIPEYWTNDSFWMDLGFPVMTTPDGRKYKPLFASLITDLDNRLNVNVDGQSAGSAAGQPFNGGFSPRDVNLGQVSSGSNGTEWSNLLRGTVTPPLPGRDQRAFALSDMEALLRYGDTGSSALTSDLFRKCPASFADPRIRRLVTTHSLDVDRPGVSPWVRFGPGTSNYDVRPTTDPDRPAVPEGPPISFPELASRTPSTLPLDPGLNQGDFSGSDGRAVSAALGRIDLNRPLPPYPHMGSGATRPFGPPLTGSNGQMAFDADAPNGPLWKQFVLALRARQQFAEDIYRRLLVVTGVPPIHPDQNPQAPPADLLRTRRWLAQLAVNIVDYVDEDDISTPFCFYTAEDYRGLPAPPPLPPDPARVSRPDNPAGGPALPGEIQWPVYWVFGTERPRLVVNEVLAESKRNEPDEAYDDTVRVFVELHNPSSLTAGSGVTNFSPYRLLIGVKSPVHDLPSGAAIVPGFDNDNVLGNPEAAVIRAATTNDDFAQLMPANGMPAQGFLLLGAPQSASDPFANNRSIPPATPVMRTSSLEYSRRFPIRQRDDPPDERTHGIAVVLRRLANPYLPFNGLPSAPNYNPYVTVDYVEDIPLQAIGGSTPPSVASWGKLQPYAAHRSQMRLQTSAVSVNLNHTFGRPNLPAPANYVDLTHLDRPLTNPLELLQVSGCQPYQLTQQFMRMDSTGQVTKFGHVAPWLDEGRTPGGSSHRLYRLFEFLESSPLRGGAVTGGRFSGKININTIWEPEILRALSDPQTSDRFQNSDINDLFSALFHDSRPASLPNPLRRTQGQIPGASDRPFRELAIGTYPGGGQFGSVDGSADSILRLHPAAGQVVEKIFNNVTTRSNVFAVWLTVGFFEVTDDATQPVTLGAEIGRAENRHIRHRMFAIIDRTNLSIASNVASLLEPVPPPPGSNLAAPRTVPVSAIRDRTQLALTGPALDWSIQPGTRLVIDTGPAQETVMVVAANSAVQPPTITAAFTRPHPIGAALALADTPGAPPVFFRPTSVANAPSPPHPPGTLTLTVAVNPATSGAQTLAGSYDDVPWKLEPGAKIILDVGPDQEVVTVLPRPFGIDAARATGSFEAVVTKPHAPGFAITNTLLGNPGPQPRFDPRDPLFSRIVRYVSIVQ